MGDNNEPVETETIIDHHEIIKAYDDTWRNREPKLYPGCVLNLTGENLPE